ncbi:DUF5615 family PIN-like protein [Roseomonas genomospecies 6]|nr:DUF5615 family PIN-like protein [Roseomonas genomospecies 6]
MDQILIDACLTPRLVAVAKARGVDATHVSFMGRAREADWDLMPFILGNDYVFVTNNRKDFLKEYAKQEIHNGLIIVIPQGEREDQEKHFTAALDFIEPLDDLVNKLVEVLEDGSVRMRDWTKDDHDPDYVYEPPKPGR